MSLRFGITMRQVDAVAYDEKRDAIARDWSYYMLNSFPEDNWMFIPNIKDEAIRVRVVLDYIAGMTDRFAILEHRRLFDPYSGL